MLTTMYSLILLAFWTCLHLHGIDLPVIPDSMDPNPVHPEYREHLARAEQAGKPLLILFTANQCKNNLLTRELLSESVEINTILDSAFVFLVLTIDDKSPLPVNEQYYSTQ